MKPILIFFLSFTLIAVGAGALDCGCSWAEIIREAPANEACHHTSAPEQKDSCCTGCTYKPEAQIPSVFVAHQGAVHSERIFSFRDSVYSPSTVETHFSNEIRRTGPGTYTLRLSKISVPLYISHQTLLI